MSFARLHPHLGRGVKPNDEDVLDSARTYLAWVGDRAPNDREKWLYCRTLIGLYEQLEAAHRNMDRYGMALAEISETPVEEFARNGWTRDMQRTAREALNPATRPTDA